MPNSVILKTTPWLTLSHSGRCWIVSDITWGLNPNWFCVKKLKQLADLPPTNEILRIRFIAQDRYDKDTIKIVDVNESSHFCDRCKFLTDTGKISTSRCYPNFAGFVRSCFRITDDKPFYVGCEYETKNGE